LTPGFKCIETYPSSRREDFCFTIVAEMFCFDDYGRPARFKTPLAEKVRDLRCESFLDLWPAREDFYEARHLANPEDSALRYVANMCNAVKWKEMMFTHSEKGDVLNDHHFVMILVVKPDFEEFARIFF